VLEKANLWLGRARSCCAPTETTTKKSIHTMQQEDDVQPGEEKAVGRP